MAGHSDPRYRSDMDADRFRTGFLLLLVTAISALFAVMIRDFLMTLLLAGVFAGLAAPLFRRIVGLLRGKRSAASMVTVLALLVCVAGPLFAILGVVAAQALRITDSVRPWIDEQLANPGALPVLLERLPGLDRLVPYREQILLRLGDLVGSAGGFLLDSASAATRGTVAFLFQSFVFVYALFHFLLHGDALLRRILYYIPLDEPAESRLVERFTSVTRATVRGTLVIGLLQGGLAGVAFAVVGIPGAVFWGTMMTLLSVIPGVGTALVWVPAALILLATGETVPGVGLAVFCGLIVGSLDNLLRPRLVGRDTQMPDLLIFLGTAGGILLFGIPGFLVGPILAALFVTVWEIYGHVFRDILPGPRSS
ncbi:MAG: AI-2E family transporter [Gemmatimonadota bacterium]|nr:AI-2E family transporter [Gemmatimonadota bacterium]MDP6529717.1 AI-2E family transporter [Gemmatimonadota bacterium]MDP6803424.1 AI-2E family transporter [Gemmatimonadota bacterium]